MNAFFFRVALTAVATVMSTSAMAQTGGQPPPSPPAGQTTPPATTTTNGPGAPTQPAPPNVPDVEVIQETQPKPKPKPRPTAKGPKPKPPPAPVAQPAALPAPDPEPEAATAPTEPPAQSQTSGQATPSNNPVYGAANSQGAAARADQSAQSPINPKQLVPSNLEGFSSSATHVNPQLLEQRQPRTLNEVFTQVPGIIVTNDDGASHHGGIGIRGSPPRRSRKVLVMEDGHANNLALWLDPSVHYWAPIDRLESFEVLRGTVIAHGPNNNYGIINARNLSPFGRNETVISSALGVTENDTGVFVDEDGNAFTGNDDYDFSSRWHMHTRQMVNNVGLVFSYTGNNIQGTWDTERLRAHDLYGALGFKGQSSDLVASLTYVRQRDNYDEANFTGDDDGDPGAAEAGFFDTKHCKPCFAPGSIYDTYNGEVWRSQIVHNAYLNDDTTLTSRIYAQQHRRDRYQIVTKEDNPDNAEDPGLQPVFDGPGADGLFDIFLPEDSMFGRLRTFRHIGVESRLELANQPFFGGLRQDIQVGARYEYQDMTNRNFLGVSGEKLDDGDSTGLTIFERDLQANTFSAFLQTNVHVTSNFNVIPGVRLEYYKVKRQSFVTAEEEGEAEEGAQADCQAAIGEDDCLEIEGINRTPFNDGFDQYHTLPGIAFSYTGFFRTTVFGGYHRGMTTGVLRNEDFPYEDEIGDNFQLGLRSTAIRGFGFELTGFHQRLHDFQFGASFSSAGDRSFGKAEEVHINGVELAGRVDSHPYTGGPLNFFGAGNYSYQHATFKEGIAQDDDGNPLVFSGNDVPEVPFTTAALTAGIESKVGWRWDLSATWTYRSAFFTDEFNTPYGGDPEGEDGQVPDIWLLSARFNLDIAETGASVFVSGDNLLDEFFISDREDGLKPGQGRTFWAGFKYKFD